MILVDSSVWIDFFKGSDTDSVQILERLLQEEAELTVSDYILTEVLQGFKKDKDFEMARKHLLLFPIYSLSSPDSYIQAAQIYRLCRQKGITIRNTMDCLIAQTALENDLVLLHDDSDFNRIAEVCPLAIYRLS
jgi:predicted nucleic acid-binding protein